jgi:hypothetical protein
VGSEEKIFFKVDNDEQTSHQVMAKVHMTVFGKLAMFIPFLKKD